MEETIENRDLENLKILIKQEKKLAKDEELVTIKVDQLIKKRGLKVTQCPTATIEEMARRHFHFVMQAAKANLCTKSLPFVTLTSFLESSSIEHCKLLFSIVEEHMDDYKTPPLVDHVQNSILRFCNDLLRRASRTAETSFCGRIMFFLSRYLPLAEKSGLNIMGHFNTQNITVYDKTGNSTESLMTATTTAVIEDEEMEVGEITDDTKEIQVTPEMYKQFWSIQKFFANPLLLFEKDKYIVFKSDISSVISLLATNKLDKSVQEDDDVERKQKRTKLDTDDIFFSKYLTSPKLLALQLNDSQLRRNFLLQSLILFQFLNGEIKLRHCTKKLVMNEEQHKFITESSEKCYKLLGETMPRGSNFVSVCKKILQRDLEWINWKNNGCPDFSDKADKAPMQSYKKRVKTEFDPSSLDLGTPELTKLWNHEIDVLAACKNEKRKFVPLIADFIRDPLDEMDPEQQVEEQYKSINTPSFQWKAARLLLTEATQYLAKPEKEPTTNLKEHLEKTIYNAAKNIEEFKDHIAAREEKEQEARKKVEESLKRKLDISNNGTSKSSPNPHAESALTDEQLEQLAEALSSKTDQLVDVFGFDKKGIKESLGDDKSAKDVCLHILQKWTENNGKSGRTLLKTLISDVEIVEIATTTLKKFNE